MKVKIFELKLVCGSGGQFSPTAAAFSKRIEKDVIDICRAKIHKNSSHVAHPLYHCDLLVSVSFSADSAVVRVDAFSREVQNSLFETKSSDRADGFAVQAANRVFAEIAHESSDPIRLLENSDFGTKFKSIAVHAAKALKATLSDSVQLSVCGQPVTLTPEKSVKGKASSGELKSVTGFCDGLSDVLLNLHVLDYESSDRHTLKICLEDFEKFRSLLLVSQLERKKINVKYEAVEGSKKTGILRDVQNADLI